MKDELKKLDKPLSAIKVLWNTIRVVGAEKALLAWIAFVLLSCAYFCYAEPLTFPDYGTALWFAFETISTIGYGDIVPTGPVCKVITAVMGLSALFVLAVLTGIVVNFFTQRIQIAQKESLLAFGHKMEHLTEMSPSELDKLERDFKAVMKHHKLDS